LRCGSSLPEVGNTVSNNPYSTTCSGTSRSAALDFSNRTALGLMLTYGLYSAGISDAQKREIVEGIRLLDWEGTA